MNTESVVDAVEERATAILHAGEAEDYGAAFWLALQRAEPEQRRACLAELRAAHEELRDREAEDRVLQMAGEEVARIMAQRPSNT